MTASSQIPSSQFPNSGCRPPAAFLRDAFCGFGSLALASLLVATGVPGGECESAGGEAAAARAEGQVGHLPVHGGRAEPHGLVRSQAAARIELNGAEEAGGVWRGQVSVRAAQRHGCSARSGRSASTARAASRSPTCFRTRPSASTTSPSSARATATRSCTRRPSTSCSAAAPTPGFPSMGSWAVYGLGSESESLPGLCRDARSRRGAGSRPADVHERLFAGRLSADAVPRRAPARFAISICRAGVSLDRRRKTVELIRQLNEASLPAGDNELAARIAAYDLAFKMQTEAPEVFDLTGETQATLDLYGIDGGADRRLRPALPAGPPAGRARRAVHGRRLRRRSRQQAVGRPQRHRRKPPADGRRDRPGRRRPAHRPQAARPARFDARPLGRRIRPLARGPGRQRPRPSQPRLHDVARRRRRPRRPMGRRDRRHRPQSRREAVPPPRHPHHASCTCSASTRTSSPIRTSAATNG